MKILIGLLILTVIMLGISLNFNRTNRALNELHNEHCVLLEKLNKIDEKCDGIARIENMLKKALATPYENDK